MTDGKSDDLGKYLKMGLKLDKNNPELLHFYGTWCCGRQEALVSNKNYGSMLNMNFDYVENFRKAYELSDDPEAKEVYLMVLREQEALRDFYTG